MTTVILGAKEFARRNAPVLARWIQWPYGLDERRRQLSRLCESIHELIDQADDSGDEYRYLFAALTCLMLALESRPISKPLCVKAHRHLQTLAAANVGSGVAADRR